MNRVTLLILTLISFNSHAIYNWETGIYTLENDVIFKVKPFHSPQFINDEVYCDDYSSSFTNNRKVQKSFCISLLESTAKWVSTMKTPEMVQDMCNDIPQQCKGQKKAREAIKEIVDENLSKLEKYDDIVIAQRQKNHEKEFKEKIELAKTEIENKKKVNLDNEAFCKQELQTIVKIDKVSLASYETDVATLDKAIQDNNFRYASHLVKNIKKPSLLISEAHNNCFQFPSFQKIENESRAKINSNSSKLNLAIDKINNHNQPEDVAPKKIIIPTQQQVKNKNDVVKAITPPAKSKKDSNLANSSEFARLAQALIVGHGYICNNLHEARQKAWDGSFYVVCDNYIRNYNIKEDVHTGIWSVTPD